MKIEKSTTTYPLSACSIDTVSENTGIFLEQIGMERRNILRMKLPLENVLLN